jgi:hypothetical protein
VRSSGVQRVFAIVELLRAVAAFMIAPILFHVAVSIGRNANAGTATALWICLGISAFGVVVGVSLYALGGVRLPLPAFERWMAGEGPALDSPPLFAIVRRRSIEARQSATAATGDGQDLRLLRSLKAACGAPPDSQATAPDADGQPGHDGEVGVPDQSSADRPDHRPEKGRPVR